MAPHCIQPPRCARNRPQTRLKELAKAGTDPHFAFDAFAFIPIFIGSRLRRNRPNSSWSLP